MMRKVWGCFAVILLSLIIFGVQFSAPIEYMPANGTWPAPVFAQGTNGGNSAPSSAACNISGALLYGGPNYPNCVAPIANAFWETDPNGLPIPVAQSFIIQPLLDTICQNNGALLYYNGTWSCLAKQNNGSFLELISGIPAWFGAASDNTSILGMSGGLPAWIEEATLANNIAQAIFTDVCNTPITGEIPYYTASAVWGCLNPGNNGEQLIQTANGPAWSIPYDGKAHLRPYYNQTNTSTSPWFATDVFGNQISCSGTNSECLQEFINFVYTAGEPAEVDGQGVPYTTESGITFSTSSKTITGLTNAVSLVTVGQDVASPYLPQFTSVTSVNSNTSITVSNFPTTNGTNILYIPNANPNYIYSTVTIDVPVCQQCDFHSHDVFLECTTASSDCVDFDSQMISHWTWEGQITWEGGSGTSYCGVHLKPTTPVPSDGIVTIADSDFYFGTITSTTGGGSPLCVDATSGSISGNHFKGLEINGGAYGILNVSLTSASLSISRNIYDFPDIHLQTDASIQDGTTTTNQGEIKLNTYIVGLAPGAQSANCVNSFSPTDNWQATCTDAQAGGTLTTGFLFHTGANSNFYTFIVDSASTCLSNGGSGNQGNCL